MVSCPNKESIVRRLQITSADEYFLDAVHYVDRRNRLGFKALGLKPAIHLEESVTERTMLELLGNFYLVYSSGPAELAGRTRGDDSESPMA